jgi:release factor glutamine methyltransferase
MTTDCATPGHAGSTISFGELEIAYDDRVLEPRPWTVDQSRWAAELAASAPEGPMLELCAGAGQIGLLAVALTGRPLVCVDLDPVACDFARQNAAAAGLAHLVEVREGRLEEAVGADERFAVVVADPPWVPRAETGRFPEDPILAIDGGEDGLDVARECVRLTARHLLPGGFAVLQLGTLPQAARISDSLHDLGLLGGEVRTAERGVLLRVDRP